MKRSLVISACLVIAVLILAAVAAVAWRARDRQARVYSDGDTINVPVKTISPRQVLWQPPMPLPGEINTEYDEYEPRIDAREQSIHFVRGKAGSNADIWFAQRSPEAAGEWNAPQPLTSINTTDDELGPELSRDGQLLLFYSNRSGGSGGYDIWVSRRSESGWQAPVNLGPAINSEHDEYSPALSPDGTRLYFASNRPQPDDGPQRISQSPWHATVRQDRHRRDFDLYMAIVEHGEPRDAAAIAPLNTTFNEGALAFSPAGDFLYFCSDRPGGKGGFDLYRSRYLRGEHQPPDNLGPEINTSANELDPTLSMGGFEIHFSSDRDGPGESQDKRSYNIFFSQAREVFVEVQAGEPLIDWASFASMVLPLLLWLLAALLALLLLLAMLKGVRSRRLSLIARCLLASLIAHLILLLLLTFWHITVSIAQAFERGGTKVMLTTNAAGDSLAAQVRGGFTESVPITQAAPAQRTEQVLPAADMPVPVQLAAELSAAAIPEPSAVRDPVRDAPPPAATAIMDLPTPANSSATIEVAAPESASAQPTAEPTRVAVDGINIPAARRAETSIETRSASIDSISMTSPSVAAMEQTAMVQPNSAPDAPVTILKTAEVDVIVPRDQLPTVEAAIETVALPSQTLTKVEERSTPELTASAEQPHVATRQSVETASANTAQQANVTIHPETTVDVHSEPSFAPSWATARESSAPSSSSRVPQAMSVERPAVSVAAIEMPVSTPMENAARHPQGESGDTEAADSSKSPATVAAAPSRAAPVASATGQFQPVHVPPAAGQGESNSASLVELDSMPASATASLATDASRSWTVRPSQPAAVPLGAAVEIPIPNETAPPVDQYSQRAPEVREQLVREMGGTPATERAVELALKWLAAHQGRDGRWAARDFDDRCGDCGGRAKFDTDVATTALALMCFLAADHTHFKDGPYREAVSRAVAWLIAQQKPDGDLRAGETMYSHGIASIALSETWGMTRDESLRQPVENAIAFICSPVNLRAGGWRYEPGQFGDTSVLGWQVMAMSSAQRGGLNVPQAYFEMARTWLDSVSTQARPGLYAYQPGQRHSPSMTAEAMFVQQLLGLAPGVPRMRDSADYLLQHLPRWRGETSSYYWYYATLAMFQHQGQAWEQWNATLTDQLLEHQHTSGALAGSWDPRDNWSKVGGRVYQTALCTLSLEVYYRYLPMYKATPVAAKRAGRAQ